MRFNWYFEPDAQDVARNNGYNLGLIGDAACKTESQKLNRSANGSRVKFYPASARTAVTLPGRNR